MAESAVPNDRMARRCSQTEDQEFLRKLRLFFESQGNGASQFDAVPQSPPYYSDCPLVESIPLGCPKLKHVSDCRRNAYKTYIKSSDEMKREYVDLKNLFTRIGGNPAVARSLQVSPGRIRELDDAVLSAIQYGDRRSIKELKRVIERIRIRALKLITFLYFQKHTFYFRNLQRWADYAGTAVDQIDLRMSHDKSLERIIHDIIPNFITANNEVTMELRDFAVRVLPSSIADEEERATTHFTSITTIATFFSSVTASTLQFSYQQRDTHLDNIVNLVWFLSLVFSISSGVNSVLSMSWRKSHIFSESKPPKPIEIWLLKAPSVLLAISACLFVVGLNIFPYSSNQVDYVSVSTLASTALHLLGLLIIATWFLVKLNWETSFMQSVRKNILWAFLCDDRVVCLNHKFASVQGWSDNGKPIGQPLFIAKLVRYTLLGIAGLARGFHPRGKHDYPMTSRSNAPNDIEHGDQRISSETIKSYGTDGQGQNEAVVNAFNDFICTSRSTFSGTFFEQCAREGLRKWECGSFDTDTLEMTAKYVLWGYPEILSNFNETVLTKLRQIDNQDGDEKAKVREGSSDNLTYEYPPLSRLKAEDPMTKSELVKL